MDNDVATPEPVASADTANPGPGLPKGSSFLPSIRKDEPIPDADERNGVFRNLVTDDADIAGLVAYSIYKQNKLDWLTAFEKAKGRVPNADELGAYIIGEGTPRRLATYRHLAEATLAGNGPEVGGGAGQPLRGTPRRVGSLAQPRGLTTGMIAAYALVALLFAVGFLLAAHYTMTSR